MKLLHSSFFLFSHIALPILCIEFLLYFVVVATFALLQGYTNKGRLLPCQAAVVAPGCQSQGYQAV